MSCIVKADLRCHFQTLPLKEGACIGREEDLEAFYQLVKLICKPFPLTLVSEKIEYEPQDVDHGKRVYQNHDFVIHIDGMIETARFRYALYQTLDGLCTIGSPATYCSLLIYDEHKARL